MKNQLTWSNLLPLRFKPKKLESLSSYLIRLCNSCGIQNRKQLRRSFSLPVHVFMRNFDYPIDFGNLPHATMCTNETLLTTTVYHLMRKFGRVSSGFAVSRFLYKNLSSDLRYCPLCLVETECYLLTWRFHILEGCARHGCHLLEQCGHCGKSIPMFSSFKLCICPMCKGDLRRCRSTKLNNTMIEIVTKRSDDLRFLLTPFDWENDGDIIIEYVGQYLAALRHKQNLTIAQLATKLGWTESAVRNIESRNPETNRAARPLVRYFQYTDYLDTTLRHVFITALKEQRLQRQTIHIPPEEVYLQAKPFIEEFSKQGKKLSFRKLAELTGIKHVTLVRNTQIRNDLSKNKSPYLAIPFKDRKMWYVDEIKQAIEHFENLGQYPAEKAILEFTGLPTSSTRIPETLMLILEAKKRYKDKKVNHHDNIH